MASKDEPIFQEGAGFNTWSIDDIYQGPGTGKYVPNVDDLVIDWNSGMYRVSAVDLSSGLSTLVEWNVPTNRTGLSDENILLGVDADSQAESFRVYLDTTVTPHTLQMDRRLHIYGSNAAYAKVFHGTDISTKGRVISAMYDGDGVFVGENIPLELVQTPDQNNRTIKAPKVGYTLNELQDGEVVTVVIYDDLSYVLSYSKLLIKNSGFVRATEANAKYITDIHLESPFMSQTDASLILMPVNMPVEDLQLTGVVTYSDGQTAEFAANGGRFRLYGLNDFIATSAGQTVPLVLTYFASDDENFYSQNPGVGNFISKNYSIQVTTYNTAYGMKLYGFPRWIDEVQGYTMDYFMYTLDRDRVYDVGKSTAIAANTPPFRPKDYGVQQTLRLVTEMDRVDTKYPKFRHVEVLQPTLLSSGDNNDNNWTVAFDTSQTEPFGIGLSAKASLVSDRWQVNISNDFNSLDEWLNHLYYAAKPLVHTQRESRPPRPNTFVVRADGVSYEYTTDDWNTAIGLTKEPKQGDNIYIRFIYRTNDGDQQLSIAGLPVHKV